MTKRTNESNERDFDFFIGNWQVAHRRLKDRLVGCTEWVEFAGTTVTWKLLGGLGNVDDNTLDLPGGAYRAVTLRTFNPATRQWSIWWLDGRDPGTLDTPVVGEFDGGVGTFFADTTLGGKSVRVRFQWSMPRAGHPRWEQAFSDDGGATWEANWEMNFTPS